MRASLLVLSSVLVFFAGDGRAGSNIRTGAGQAARWFNLPIPFTINPGGVPGFTGELERLIVVGAVRDAFRAWTEIPNGAIAFKDGGLSSQTAGGFDQVNLISFQDTTFSFPPGALAVTTTFFSAATGQIVDADILFNPNRVFSPVGADNSVDIVAVGIHEIGHLIGLDHTGILSSIMNPFAESAAGVASRMVRADDAITAAALYPAPAFPLGTGFIAGTITTSAGMPVKSAHVIAVSHPTGAPVASQLSGGDGNYRIDGLPPGNYLLFVEPLDGPIGVDDFGDFYSDGQSDFVTTAFGGIASPTVIALGTEQGAMANIMLPPNPASKLNIELIGGAVVGNSISLRPHTTYLPRDRQYEIAATEATRATDTTFDFSAPDIMRVGPTFSGVLTNGTPFRGQDIAIGAGAALGPSNVSLSNADSLSAMVGGVVVTVNPKVSLPLRESAALGTALSPGSFVSIFGDDLAEGLFYATNLPLPTSLGGVSVKIGNRFAPLFFVSPWQINALVPYEVSGQVNLQVVTGPGAGGNVVAINLSSTSPGIFTANSAGTGQGVIVHPDGGFVAPVGGVPGAAARPARRGDVIRIFASGLGPVTPAFPSGLDAGASGTSVPMMVNLPRVMIGGQLAALDFAGLAPNFPGLYEIKARVPDNTPSGDNVPLQITTFEGQVSNAVTIAISP